MKSKLLVTALFAVAVCSGQAFAQSAGDYPNRPIRIIVPVAPGGNVDIVARTVAAELAKSMGQPVVVENRPSAASIVGTQMVAKAAPDGYTLLAHSSTFFTAPTISANAGYDPVKDFTPITLTCKAPMFMEVNTAVPARTVAEFVALAKAKPGEVSNASSGNGSTGHMAGEVFSSRANVKLLNVFYKGSAQAVIDVISGQAMLMFDQISTSGPHVKGGKLRALAVTSLQRSPLFPDVPTMDESGYPGYEDVTLNFLLAPAGTPKAIVDKLHAEVVKAYKQPELIKRFAERSIELVASPSPEAFGETIKSEVARLSKVAREAGIKAE
ncbi:MAG: tripartite tricarboxylate transporter substrate binding protein [Betaproteobacteria bacterium]|nr:tripartite tricarboxylate transporter substrate binding protein [Pseudomonadota bacterium]